MARINQVLELVTGSGAENQKGAFQRELRPIQRVVEDLCKLGHADQIITQVRASLEKAIKAKFDTLAQ